MRVRARVILPTLYLIIAGYLLGMCILHVGHWWGCHYSYYSMIPVICLMPNHPFGTVIGFVLVGFQYFLLGKLIEVILERGH